MTQFENGLTVKVELSISCRNVLDMDVLSKSDPMVVVFLFDPDSSKWYEFGRTEIVWDNLNPNFAKKFILDYHFEELQKMKFQAFDIDSNSQDLSRHDFLGEIETTLGEIVSSGTLEKKLLRPGHRKQRGTIILNCEEQNRCETVVHMTIQGFHLDKKGSLFGSSNPFLEFLRVTENGSHVVTHRTPVIKNSLNPKWEPFQIPLATLCNGDMQRNLMVRCWDWNRNGSHSLIGHFTMTMEQLKSAGAGFECALINPKKRGSSKYTNSGLICFTSVGFEKRYSFLEYIQGGTELNCCIAIDFTGSNGDPRQMGTLHYDCALQPSQYAIALQAVGEILQDYDSDNLFPAYGFGAKIPPTGPVSHCFPLNLDYQNPACVGVQGVLDAYHAIFASIKLYGPTNFAPCINTVASQAAKHMDGSQYYILLIITDGVITDMPQTKHAIVRAAALPLSIIIVGVGEADFKAMVELDGDDVRVSSNGVEAVRDIVQFVPFNQFSQSLFTGDVQQVKRHLAREVLAEIPDQLVSFMRLRGIVPRSQTRQTFRADSASLNRGFSRAPENASFNSGFSRASESASFSSGFSRAPENASFNSGFSRASENASFNSAHSRAPENASFSSGFSRAPENASFSSAASRATLPTSRPTTSSTVSGRSHTSANSMGARNDRPMNDLNDPPPPYSP